MRKVLFASTALVAFSAISGAQAAEPIKLQLGGYSHQWWGYANNSNDGDGVTGVTAVPATGATNSIAKQNSVVNRDNTEIFFTGSTKLDNGLSVAIRVELEGAGGANSSAIDESNLTLSGGFGRLILGAEDNVTGLMMNITPTVGYGVGHVEGNIWARAPNNVSTLAITGFAQATYADDSDVQKVTYITPSFFGFQAGYTYSPNANDSNYSIASDQNGTDAHSAAISYNNKFGDVGVKADFGAFVANGGTFRTMNEGTSTSAVKGWRTGANVSFAGFTVGGFYYKQNDHQRTDTALVTTPVSRQGNLWSLGAKYETGPWGVSLGYHKETVEGRTGIAANDVSSEWELAGNYILGPGIDVALAYQRWDFKDEAGASQQANKADVIVSALRVSF